MAKQEPEKLADRRRSTRAPISRPVLFTGTRGGNLLRRGEAVDISAGGILIHTAQPELLGRHLDLELHGEDGVETTKVIMVKGEVARLEALAGGQEHAMGVRFLQMVPATDVTGPRMRPATHQESEDLAGAIQRQLANMAPAARLELSGAALQAASSAATDHESIRTRPPKAVPAKNTRGRFRRWFRTILILVLVPALLGALLYAVIWGFHHFQPPTRIPLTPVVEPEAERDPSATDEAPNLLAERLAAIEANGAAYYINRGSLLLVQGKNVAASQAFRSAQEAPAPTPMEQFIAQLGEAQALATEGDAQGAIALLERPFDGADVVPDPWLALKAAFLEGLYNRPEAVDSLNPLVNAFTFEAIAPSDGQGGPAPEADSADGAASSIRLEVDTTRHLLTVLEDNAIKAVYPVGLGYDGKTPEGYYNIVNKIENPDWYNRGQVVKAGDPANQLGTRWMGLADEEGPTPLGIHGTIDPESIGANLSQGCIRMRPADVEALFRIVDVGTPVHVRAL